MNLRKLFVLTILLSAHSLPRAGEEHYWDEPILLRPSPTLAIEETHTPGRISSVVIHPENKPPYALVQTGGNSEFEPVQIIPAYFTAPMKIPVWTLWQW